MKINFSTLVFSLFSLLVSAQNNTRPNVYLPAATGMQVNSYTGSLYYERHDLFVPGRGLDIDFTFYYNTSIDTTDWGYGYGWTHPYNMNYTIQADTFKLVKSDGRKDYFIKNGSVYTPLTGIFDVLTEYQPGKFLLRSKSGMKYYFDDAANHKLTKMEDRNGNAITPTWTGNLMTLLTDAAGRQITLTYQNNHLATLTDALDSPTRTWTYTYDSDGNLSSVTNPLNGTVLYAYDVHAMTRMTDENTNETTIEYVSPGGAVKTIGTCLSRHTFTFDIINGKSTVSEIVNDAIQTTTYEFDAQGRNIARKGNCCGFETTFQYDNSNNITQSTNANGNTNTNTFDGNGNATQLNDPAGCNIQMQYEPNFNQNTSFKDKNGNTTSFTYDSKGNLTAVARPLGVSESYAYDAFGNQTSHTDARGNATTYVYNANGYLTKINHPVGSFTTQFSYDNRGNKLTQTDANGHVTHFKFDALNRLTETEDPLGNKTTYAYDARGNKTKETNALGNATDYKYDPLDRLIEVKAPLNVVTKYAYDSRGNLLAETDPRGSTTTYIYDSRNFLASQKDPLGHETTYAYDGLGNQTLVTDPNGNSTQYNYDQLNRLTKTTDALGFETNYEYDCNGNPKKVTDANGNATSYAYDALNRQVSMTDALNFTTNFEFDKNNNLTKITDAKGNPTSYEYDALNRKTKETFADNTTKIFTYDGAGNVGSRKDNAGNMTFYTYDENNRLTLRDYPDANDDHFNYDALGRMTEATNQNAVVTFTYDALNRILGETLNGKTTGYAYNTATGKRTLIYPSGRVIEEYYDARNQLGSIKESNETIASFAYDPAGRMTTRSYGNGTVTAYSYDANNRVTDIVANPNEFINFHYAYDNVGNELYEEKKHHPTHSEEYGYDAKYQLTSFKVGTLAGGAVPAPATQTAYNYDGLGNRVTVVKDGGVTTYQVNEMNEYLQENGMSSRTYQYDENGNLISDGIWQYSYTSENRLLIASRPNISINNKYDALYRKIMTQNDSIIESYYYKEMEVVEERNDFLLENNTYIFGGNIDAILSQSNKIGTFFYYDNQIKNTSAITNQQADIAERYEYDSFGKPTFYSPDFTQRNNSTINNKYLFTGRELENNTSLYYYRNRHYSFNLGSFQSRDFLDYFDNTNLYAYVGNNPVTHSDPLGLCKDCLTPLKQCNEKANKDAVYERKEVKEIFDKGKKILEEKYEKAIESCHSVYLCESAVDFANDYAEEKLSIVYKLSLAAVFTRFLFRVQACFLQYDQCQRENSRNPCCKQAPLPNVIPGRGDIY
ncbi:MAG: hypothetical protein GC192_16610 [Bacteroidetes bacterium]|nr:hypothetical protein [Bacteroidota bacterium]